MPSQKAVDLDGPKKTSEKTNMPLLRGKKYQLRKVRAPSPHRKKRALSEHKRKGGSPAT